MRADDVLRWKMGGWNIIALTQGGFVICTGFRRNVEQQRITLPSGVRAEDVADFENFTGANLRLVTKAGLLYEWVSEDLWQRGKITTKKGWQKAVPLARQPSQPADPPAR